MNPIDDIQRRRLAGIGVGLALAVLPAAWRRLPRESRHPLASRSIARDG